MEEDKLVLQIKEYKNYDKSLLNIRKKLVADILGLKKVNFYHKKDLKKGINFYIFYEMGDIIYLEKKRLLEVLEKINKIEKIEEQEEMEGKIRVKNHDLATSFLSIYPRLIKKQFYFDYQDIYDKEHLERIDKYKVPLYKVFRENKYALLKILKNHQLNYTPKDINYFLLHDRIPFINYDHLKENLEKYYKVRKENYHKIFKKDLEDACLYLMGRNEVILVEEPEGYNIYTKKEEDKDEEILMKRKYIERFDKKVKNHREVAVDTLSNKELLNLEIIDNIVQLDNRNPIDIDKKNNYHWGYYDNGIYQCEENLEEKKKLKPISNDLIDIKFLLDYDNYHNVIIEVEGSENLIDIMYFYIPKDKEFVLRASLEKLWEKGYFLSPFGKAVYSNDEKILEDQLVKPEWIQSSNKKEFDKLIKYISAI